MIQCPHADRHGPDCEALIDVFPSGHAIAWCRTHEARYRALYGHGEAHDLRPWPSDWPMWDYNNEERREFYFDPITRVEVAPPDRAKYLRVDPVAQEVEAAP